jgi:hypothetical protein
MTQDPSSHGKVIQEQELPATSAGRVSPDAKETAVLSKASRRRRTSLAVAVVVVIVLALALGLGLGLGLKRSGKEASGNSSGSPSPPTPQTPSENSQASLALPLWRSNVEDYTLDIASWDFNAPPTTREYNFTIAEIELSPDGVFRTMIAINGRFPGELSMLHLPCVENVEPC